MGSISMTKELRHLSEAAGLRVQLSAFRTGQHRKLRVVNLAHMRMEIVTKRRGFRCFV